MNFNHTMYCNFVYRSESFANDAQILEKLSQLKVIMQEEEDEAEKAVVPVISNGPLRKGKLGTETKRSESEDLEQAVLDYMCQDDPIFEKKSTPVVHVTSKPKHHKFAAVSKPLPAISRSPHSPARMPVTENDPLGALNGPDDEDEDAPKLLPPSVEQSPAKSWLLAEEAAGGPVLFKDSSRHRRAKTEEEGKKFHPPVMRSATYHQGLGSEEPSSITCRSDAGKY